MIEIFIVLIGGTYWILKLLGEHLETSRIRAENKKREEIEEKYRNALRYPYRLDDVEKMFMSRKFTLDFVTKIEDDLVYIFGRKEYDEFVKDLSYDRRRDGIYCDCYWTFSDPKFLNRYATFLLYLAYKGKLPWWAISGIGVPGFYDSSKTVRLVRRIEDVLNKKYDGKIKFVFTRHAPRELDPNALYGGDFVIDCFSSNSYDLRLW